MKQKIAVVLAAAMLSSCMPFAVLADGEATPGEAQVQTGNVLTDASASGKNASLDTASDGAIQGSVDFSGAKMVVKLYRDGKKLDERRLGQSGSFEFTDLPAGDYTLRFYFWGEGDLPPKKEISVTIGYDKKAETGGTEGGGTGSGSG
ncbi:MAG: hypothetical protein ACI4MP_04530, partial [Candidatus Ventricola sp.]